MQNENSGLRMKLNDLEQFTGMCSIKINACITVLEEEIQNSNNLKDNSSVQLALANLKQVTIFKFVTI